MTPAAAALPPAAWADLAALALSIEPPTTTLRPIETRESTMVVTEAVITMKNFPSTMFTRRTGLHRSVSMVPRSFSPAVRSIAGYIAPVKHMMMMR